MAISKTQPMRPAEIDLIEASNSHENTLSAHTQVITILVEGLADEISDRESADRALGTRIDNETQARTNADSALGTRIDNETQARESADTSLGTRIGNETQARTSADNALGARIDNETQARESADTNLSNGIGQEASAREGADLALGIRIDNETQARENADTALQGQIGNGFSSQNTITAYAQALDLFLGTRTDLDTTVVNSILALAASSETLEAFVSRFKVGLIDNITIPANDSISASETFAEPFAQDAACIVFAQVVTNESASLFTYALISCTYSGFTYSISNSDADAHTVSLGYIAVKTN